VANILYNRWAIIAGFEQQQITKAENKDVFGVFEQNRYKRCC
jgi:hypothetical protein